MRVDNAKLNRARALVAEMDRRFSDKAVQSYAYVWRGEYRALAYAIKTLDRLLASPAPGRRD